MAVRLLNLRGKVPIFKQLQLEEALFRMDKGNWCILNEGRPPATVVMGISGKPEKLLEIDRCKQDRIPVIKRFTGGGTVVTDTGIAFASFIFNADIIEGKPKFPQELMQWTQEFYGPLFQRQFLPTS